MNENLEKVLATVIEKALNVAEKTGELVMEEAPLLIQEFLNWKLAECIIILIFSLVLFAIAVKCVRGLNNAEDDEETAYLIFGCVLLGIPSVILFAVWIFDLIQILIAPKIYLLEYFVK